MSFLVSLSCNYGFQSQSICIILTFHSAASECSVNIQLIWLFTEAFQDEVVLHLQGMRGSDGKVEADSQMAGNITFIEWCLAWYVMLQIKWFCTLLSAVKIKSPTNDTTGLVFL